MKLLMLGGRRYVGRHLVEAALARGHELTLFNRGRTNPGLFAGVEQLTGDRDGGLGVLAGRSWDAAVDLCGYVPRIVGPSSRLLADQVERYAFLSSQAVYASGELPADEHAQLVPIGNPTGEEITFKNYGPYKILCEQAIERNMPGRGLILRAGHIMGPNDHTDRFSGWIRRISRGGEVLAPGAAETPFQFIDARDLAKFALLLVEARASGPYNVSGPKHPLTWGGLFDECRRVCGSDATFTWVGQEFLEGGLVSAKEVPLWQRRVDPPAKLADLGRARAAGLTWRPVAESIQDTLDWDRAEGLHITGFNPEREKKLLELWHARQVAQAERGSPSTEELITIRRAKGSPS